MTIFQKIIDRQIPATIVYEDEYTLAFRDIAPQAPVHVLVIPKRAIAHLSHASDDDGEWLGRLLLAAREVARREGIDSSGYRLVINNGRDAGQTVDHLHVHVLGGRSLVWPPG
jgi:histidine triad (HIT) family protein